MLVDVLPPDTSTLTMAVASKSSEGWQVTKYMVMAHAFAVSRSIGALHRRMDTDWSPVSTSFSPIGGSGTVVKMHTYIVYSTSITFINHHLPSLYTENAVFS